MHIRSSTKWMCSGGWYMVREDQLMIRQSEVFSCEYHNGEEWSFEWMLWFYSHISTFLESSICFVVCVYLQIRCCARCGGKVSLRSNKVIWVCILCRKKQELLIKTGQWINQPLSAMNPMSSNVQVAGGQMGAPGSVVSMSGAFSGQPNQHLMSTSMLQRARSVEIPSSGPAMAGPGMAGNAASK